MELVNEFAQQAHLLDENPVRSEAGDEKARSDVELGVVFHSIAPTLDAGTMLTGTLSK